ncbi:hypothetical protein AVEN_144314-1 [Araneus ventricosus]|uniref:Uncharacterized protein n=1 Tax=Araneus ventricosus TaxID=182803 RepID=A0A4Y2J6W7_ARAVE|nr:hypothetical protein AVEN_144314-1 [Araneus ventricosus]
MQMHVFVDVCKEAHATCVFLSTYTSQGVKVVFVRAKSRVAPIKQVTIPRLELMANCTHGWHIRYSKHLILLKLKPFFGVIPWLYWLREKGGWSVFVSNRIKEIKTLFRNSEWRYVPGKINPADLISRGCSPSHLVGLQWWEGPLWLVESPDTWPVTELINCETSEISSERKKVRLYTLNLSEEKVPWYARKFSKFHSILRLVAWVLRLIYNVRGRINERKRGQFTVEEKDSAEIQLIRYIQAQSFPDEKSIANLCVFRDENNIICVKTRITERIDTPHFLSPNLLPNNCV